MKRTPIQRKTPLRSTGRPKPKKRRASETLRIYGGEARIRFVAGLPCVVMGCKRVPSENCHAESGGTGRKADAETIFPACHTHHRELHTVGVRTFETLHHLSLSACAEATARAWRQQEQVQFAG